jgi:2-phospho-L-lactate transferase/gluconeogenesis factor (CofD/UPF0052 family)
MIFSRDSLTQLDPANGEPLRVVAIGGGTGLSTLLHGLRAHVTTSNPSAA